MSDLSTRIAALPSDKQAALLQQLKRKKQQEQRAAEKPPTTDRWIVRYRPNEQARLRLFCFPYAGGGASVFRSWAEEGALEGIEVCGVQLPGRENRIGEPVYTELTALVQTLARVISPYLDRPFAFFGYSMGALISFELARELRRSYNKQPVHLGFAAFRAPQLPNPNIKIYYMPDEVFKVVMRADGIPEQVLQNDELMQAMLPTLRADYELCDTYQFREEPPFACPFSLFGGQDDVRVNEPDLNDWRVHSSAPATLQMLPGPHLFIHSSTDLLLHAFAQDLARSAAQAGV